MKNILISLFLFGAFSGCGNSGSKDLGNQAGVPVVTPQVTVQVYAEHNPAACPVNLIGTYQLVNNRINRGTDDMLHVSTQQDGVMIVTQQSRGSTTYKSLTIADGVRRSIENADINDYQISYCKNQTIVTVGHNRNGDFNQVLYGSRQGLELSSSSTRERPQVLVYRRTSM